MTINQNRFDRIAEIASMTRVAINYEVMSVITLSSVEAQNGFGNLLDKAQREIVSVTRRGRTTALVMSPEVLQDYVAWQIEQHTKSNNVQEALSQAVLDQVDSGIEHYEKTGLHVSFDEVRDWAKSVRLNRD